MPLRQLQLRVPMQDAVDRQANPCHCLPQYGLMGHRTDTVQEYTGQPHIPVIFTEPQSQRRCRSSHGFCINDKQHRGFQQLGYFRCGTDALTSSVIQAHYTFDDSQLCLSHGASKSRGQYCPRHQPCIQILPRPSRGQLMIAGIDIIRACLKRLHPDAACSQHCQ